MLLGLALGFDGYRTFQRATRMRDVFEALHGDVAVHTAHFMGSSCVSCLLAFRCSVFLTIYHCFVSVEISLMGLGKGLREFSFLLTAIGRIFET